MFHVALSSLLVVVTLAEFLEKPQSKAQKAAKKLLDESNIWVVKHISKHNADKDTYSLSQSHHDHTGKSDEQAHASKHKSDEELSNTSKLSNVTEHARTNKSGEVPKVAQPILENSSEAMLEEAGKEDAYALSEVTIPSNRLDHLPQELFLPSQQMAADKKDASLMQRGAAAGTEADNAASDSKLLNARRENWMEQSKAGLEELWKLGINPEQPQWSKFLENVKAVHEHAKGALTSAKKYRELKMEVLQDSQNMGNTVEGIRTKTINTVETTRDDIKKELSTLDDLGSSLGNEGGQTIQQTVDQQTEDKGPDTDADANRGGEEEENEKGGGEEDEKGRLPSDDS